MVEPAEAVAAWQLVALAFVLAALCSLSIVGLCRAEPRGLGSTPLLAALLEGGEDRGGTGDSHPVLAPGSMAVNREH